MGKHSTERNVFAASMNLQMSHLDQESYDRCSKIILHSSRTTSILIGAGVICVALCGLPVLGFEQPENNLYPLAPMVLFLITYARYRNLHKHSLDIIKNLNKNADQRLEAAMKTPVDPVNAQSSQLHP